MSSRERPVVWIGRVSNDLPTGRSLVVALVLSVGVTLALAASPVVAAAARCPNEAIRTEQGAAALALPECRAYEMVTPPGEYPNLINNPYPAVGDGPGSVEAEASATAGGVAFRSWYVPSGSPTSGFMFSSIRGQDGWTTTAIEPKLSPQKVTCAGENTYFTADLAAQLLTDEPYRCAGFEPPLAAGESRTSRNLLVHRGTGPGYVLVNRAPEGITPGEASFQAASVDMSHVVFSERAQLTAAAPPGEDLYDWNDGELRLVGYLPDGVPVQGMLAAGTQGTLGGFGQSPATLAHSLSSDGERAVFEAGGALYLRENAGQAPSAIVSGSSEVDGEQCSEPAKACTVQLDASHGPGSSGGGVFWRASVDDSRIFFTDESRLTPESTAASGKPDLYEFAVGTGQLTDLTVDPAEAANVQGVVGASEDGSYLYFVATGVLSEQPNELGSTAERREPNLYVRHAGVTSYVATLSRYDGRDWGAEHQIALMASEVSPDGELLAFNSIAPLTGYENTPAEPSDCEGTVAHKRAGEPCGEIFLYNAKSGRLSCVSCSPSAGNPTGIAELRYPEGTFPRRALSTDGSVFFDTPSPLLGQDSNGVNDVYEWSPEGVGACTEASATFEVEADGCLYSISTGTSTEPSYFVDASESGDDAYILTGQGLVGADTDNELSLYDVRVDGGFPGGSGEVVQETTCQSAEACKPPPGEPPAQLFAASSALSSGGNLAAPPEPLTPTSPAGSIGVVKRGLSRSQKLARALRHCRRRPRRKRASCQEAARRKYAGKANGQKSGRGGAR